MTITCFRDCVLSQHHFTTQLQCSQSVTLSSSCRKYVTHPHNKRLQDIAVNYDRTFVVCLCCVLGQRFSAGELELTAPLYLFLL